VPRSHRCNERSFFRKERLALRKDSDLARLKQHLQNLLRQRYGRTSERIDPDQLLLFAHQLLEVQKDSDEAEQSDGADQSDAAHLEAAGNKTRTKRGGGGRKPAPDVPISEEHNYFPDSLACSCCGTEMKEFATVVTDQLDYVPANFFRIRHVVHKFSCTQCHNQVEEGKKPEQIHSGGIPTEGLFAQLIVAKHVDHSPVERQAKTYQRQGVDIPVSSMGRWMRMSAKSLGLIAERMRTMVLLSKVLEVDESPFEFLDKKRELKKMGAALLDQRLI